MTVSQGRDLDLQHLPDQHRPLHMCPAVKVLQKGLILSHSHCQACSLLLSVMEILELVYQNWKEPKALSHLYILPYPNLFMYLTREILQMQKEI